MKHLSPEQISSVVAGISIPQEMHSMVCTECATEVERYRNVLSMFRNLVRESALQESLVQEGAMRSWLDQQSPCGISVREGAGSPSIPARSMRRTPVTWVFAAAVLAVVVALPMYQDSREQELKLQAQRDDQLLDDVNAQLSRSGPLAMDPLMRLMVSPVEAGASAPARNGDSSENRNSGRKMAAGDSR